jgi:hypothetical protein
MDKFTLPEFCNRTFNNGTFSESSQTSGATIISPVLMSLAGLLGNIIRGVDIPKHIMQTPLNVHSISPPIHSLLLTYSATVTGDVSKIPVKSVHASPASLHYQNFVTELLTMERFLKVHKLAEQP